jgi:hypothetical protein
MGYEYLQKGRPVAASRATICVFPSALFVFVGAWIV